MRYDRSVLSRSRSSSTSMIVVVTLPLCVRMWSSSVTISTWTTICVTTVLTTRISRRWITEQSCLWMFVFPANIYDRATPPYRLWDARRLAAYMALASYRGALSMLLHLATPTWWRYARDRSGLRWCCTYDGGKNTTTQAVTTSLTSTRYHVKATNRLYNDTDHDYYSLPLTHQLRMSWIVSHMNSVRYMLELSWPQDGILF